MIRLGEILIERGIVTREGLRSAVAATRRHGGRLGTWIVRLGLASEVDLLSALSHQTGCPSATGLDLSGAPAALRALIPSAFAKRHMVIAFRRKGRYLDVATVNPNDLMLIDELASVTGLVVRPHVATEMAVATALAIPMSQPAGSTAPPPGPPPAKARQWRQFWRLESTPQDLFRSLLAPALPPPPHSAARFPTLAERTNNAGPPPALPEGLMDALAASLHRDHVAALVLDQLAELAPRVAIFALHQGKVLGWSVRGVDVVEEDFHTLILPLDRPSVFLNLTRGADVHVGPLVGGEGNTLLIDALGPPAPRDAIVVPIKVRGKPAAFIWLDRTEASVADISLEAVQQIASSAGLALEILVLRQKIKASGRLTERPGAD